MSDAVQPLPSQDLAAYVDRIGCAGALAPTAQTLAALHLAHATRIPFENLDILLGRPIRLDLASLVDKLLRARRGGYCFEQNLLFASALAAIGFPLSLLAARVRYRTTRTLPRTHMLLAVETEGERYLADVGFGRGLLLPIRLGDGCVAQQFAWSYRLQRDGDAWLLQSRDADGWGDLYAFTEEPQLPVDYEIANHYVSTHPASRFVGALFVQRPAPDERRTLYNRTLTVERADGAASRELAGDDALLAELADGFGLSFPPGTRFRFDETFGR